MRIALVSPYSWTYPGGVTRHIEALAEQYLEPGPRCARARAVRSARPDRLGACTAAPDRSVGPAPDYLVSLGRTVGLKANGSVSNLSIDADRRREAPPRAQSRPLRRGSHPRAGRADGRLGGNAAAATAAGRDVPLLLQQVAPEHARQRRSARARCSTTCTSGSPSRRPPPGPASAGSAVAIG